MNLKKRNSFFFAVVFLYSSGKGRSWPSDLRSHKNTCSDGKKGELNDHFEDYLLTTAVRDERDGGRRKITD